jgi:transposase
MCTCCEQLRDELSGQSRQLEAVRQELSLALQTISMMRHRMFGRSSEQMHPDQGRFELLLNECSSLNGIATVAEPEKMKLEFERRRKAAEDKLNGRLKIPDHLERVDRIIDLPESEKTCPATGLPMIRIGEEITEKLAYEAGKVYVIRSIRPKYASPDRRSGTGIKTAPVPEEPIDRCKADVSLLTQIIVSKYCDHLPLHRQVQMFQRHGIELPKSTMCDWVRDCAEVFKPLYNHLRDTVLASDYINADDTPMVFKARKNNKGSSRGHMWAYLCRVKKPPGENTNSPPENKLMFFDFSEDWSEDHPFRVLKNFKGHLQTDAYPGFKNIPGKLKDIIAIGCWAHARRKFYQAAKIGVREAEPFVTLINILYRIEHRIADMKENGASDEYLLGLRKKRANRVMDRFFEKVKTTTFLPKSPLGKALTYAINQERELRRYVVELRFTPDNNFAEGNLRPLCIGKKNFVMLGSECGGRTAAVLYTLIGTCRANGINPHEYIVDILARINTHPYSKLSELLPHNWESLRSK